MADRKNIKTADFATPWEPPAAPELTKAEADAAIESGGLPGVLAALRSKAGVPIIEHADVLGVADSLIDQFRAGHGGPDHEIILDQVGRCVLAVRISLAALTAVARWIDDHPGSIVVDGAHSSNKRRVFN